MKLPLKLVWTGVFALAFVLSSSTLSKKDKKEDIDTLLLKVYNEVKTDKEGKNADYIPYLEKVSSDLFAISVVNTQGETHHIGDVEYDFGIESISKVMVLSLAMEQYSIEEIEEKIGVNATGQPFNSVLAVETISDRTVNPFVNAGAMATNSLIQPSEGKTKDQTIDDYFELYSGRKLPVIEELFQSEMETNQHNVGIAVLLQSYGRMYSDPYEATESYTRQCSYAINTDNLAVMAAVLANGGVNPVTGKRVVAEENVNKILAVMATAGMYDASGEWLYFVGLPAKSGVGGGIMAVSPGKFGIAAFAPPLDEAGNSVKAQLAIQEISEALNLNVFN